MGVTRGTIHIQRRFFALKPSCNKQFPLSMIKVFAAIHAMPYLLFVLHQVGKMQQEMLILRDSFLRNGPHVLNMSILRREARKNHGSEITCNALVLAVQFLQRQICSGGNLPLKLPPTRPVPCRRRDLSLPISRVNSAHSQVLLRYRPLEAADY